MNVLVFLAGVSLGWGADRLYQSYSANRTNDEDENETLELDTEKKLLKERHDDLSQLKGVGPKLAKALDAIGIYNYKQLSELSADLLAERLQETDGRFNRPTLSAIIERAKHANKDK